MKYIINGSVQYDVENSKLTAVEKYSDEIKLTAMQNKLLLYLVINSGNSISRDKVLKDVWGEDSRSASNTNLNNYISILRKFFEYFEEKDLIITLRGEGFVFKTKSLDVINSSQDSLEIALNIDKHKKLGVIGTLHKNLKVASLSFLLLTSCMLMLFLLGKTNDNDNDYVSKIEKYENCTFKFIKINGFENYGMMDASKVKQVIETEGYDCKQAATVFFYLSSTPVRSVDENDSKSFFAYCIGDKNDGERTTCENYNKTNFYR